MTRTTGNGGRSHIALVGRAVDEPEAPREFVSVFAPEATDGVSA